MKSAFKDAALTWVELLVAIAVLAVLATLATLMTPAVTVYMVQGQLAQTLNNARQLQIATQMMAADNLQAGSGIEWTTIYDKGRAVRPAATEEFFTALTKGGYVTKNELKKLLAAPGKGPGQDDPTVANSCFKFFQVSQESPKEQPLLVTANWTPQGLSRDEPYGMKEFVVYNKGGGGMSRQMARATDTNIFPSDPKLGYTLQTLK